MKIMTEQVHIFQQTTMQSVSSPTSLQTINYRTTSFLVSADLKCRLLDTEETSGLKAGYSDF